MKTNISTTMTVKQRNLHGKNLNNWQFSLSLLLLECLKTCPKNGIFRNDIASIDANDTGH